MRIIYFEDDSSALFKVDYMKEALNHEVWYTQNYLTLLSWLDVNPGADFFDVAMFDLNITAETLPSLDPNES